MADFSSFTDSQLLAIEDAFDTADLETCIGEEATIFWYEILEEIAQRDLMEEEMRGLTANWVVDRLVPLPVKRAFRMPPGTPVTLKPGSLGRVSGIIAKRKL